MVSLPASRWRDLPTVTSHHQMFPNKPPYLRMTSVCPLPSYMSGYLHQLGGHSSGVYSYVSLPRLLETNRKSESPPLKGFGSSVLPFSERKYDISCERVSKTNQAYVKRRDKLKNKLSSKKRITIENFNNKTVISASHITKARKLPESRKVPHIENVSNKNKMQKINQSASIEEWTEKLLEEARKDLFSKFCKNSILTAPCYRDDLELVDISVQTDLMGDTRDQWTQTDDLLGSGQLTDSQSKFELTVTGLACHAVKQSLYEILQEEVEIV